MSYSFYKIIHIFGILALFMALGGLALHTMNGGDKKFANRKWVLLFHGLGLTVILISGFGLLARIGVAHGGLPLWVYAKLLIWLVMGGIIAAIPKMKSSSKPMWLVILSLGTLAGWLAGTKPF